jgi:hypothetical protein
MSLVSGETNRVNEAILESKGYLKKNAKTDDVSAESTFGRYLSCSANHVLWW